MFNGSGIHKVIKSGIRAECISSATFYSNTLGTRVTKWSPQELFFGKEVLCAHNLRMFGERRIVTRKNKIQGMLKGQVTVCIFVEYPPNHACDVYMILSLKKNIIKSRDILWLSNSFG
jgi:hypothetical protein